MTASGPSGIVGPTHWQRTAPHFNETVRPWQGRHGYVRHARRSTPPRKRNATASRRGHLWRILRVGITLLRSVGWSHRHHAVETQLWAGWWRPYVRKVYETTHGSFLSRSNCPNRTMQERWRFQCNQLRQPRENCRRNCLLLHFLFLLQARSFWCCSSGIGR